MFLNVRLMIVAILAAIAGISCGLGLFATFRVNHEPLARLAEGSPPMQLAFDHLALGPDARAGMEVPLPVTSGARTISLPVIVPSPEPASPEQAGADSTATTVATELAGVEQTDAGAQASDQSNTANPAVAAQTDSPGVSPEAAAVEPSAQSNAANPAIALQSEPSSVASEAADAAPNQPDVIATAQDQTPAASAAAASTGQQTAALSTAALDKEPAAKPAKAAAFKPSEVKTAKPKARASHPAAPARRATKVVRARRIVTTVAAQSAYPYSQLTYSQPAYSQQTYSQPAYTWMDGAAQASQPVRRIQVRRSRVVTQAAPIVRSTPSTSTAGLSGTQ
jgi:hypothetical protein